MRKHAAGSFSVTVPAPPLSRYRFRLDGDGPFPDPWSHWQPDGVHGASALLPPRSRPPSHRPVPRGRAQTTYELHIGTFTERGTYLAAAARMRELRRLGVDTVQLMPLAEFPGGRNWGYDGAYLYAPTRAYGTPNDLAKLVDAAHRAGLAIILDAVYNHFGPDGAYIHRFAPEFFSDRHRTPWGPAIDYSVPEIRSTVTDSARWWVSRHGFDGFRLDAVNTIVDDQRPHLLQEIVQAARRGYEKAYVAVEDSRNYAPVVTRDRVDAVLSEDFSYTVRARLAGERVWHLGGFEGSLAELATEINTGWLRTTPPPLTLPQTSFVFFFDNHDQVGHRSDGARLAMLTRPQLYRAVSTLLLTLPQRVLLFMGQETAAESVFHFFTDHKPELGRAVAEGRRRELGRQIPDPQDPLTFARSKLQRRSPSARWCGALYRDLLWLRAHDPVLSRPDGARCEAWVAGEILYVERRASGKRRLLAVTLSGDPGRELPDAELLFNSEARRYAGDGRLTLARPAAVLLTP